MVVNINVAFPALYTRIFYFNSHTVTIAFIRPVAAHNHKRSTRVFQSVELVQVDSTIACSILYLTIDRNRVETAAALHFANTSMADDVCWIAKKMNESSLVWSFSTFIISDTICPCLKLCYSKICLLTTEKNDAYTTKITGEGVGKINKKKLKK